jgi:DNA invertase Pin-like site-specific DNA recombinase
MAGGHTSGGRSAKAWGYLRVSTAEQASSGLGLDAQLAAITATAAKLGFPLAGTFTDAGLSGSLSLQQRPALADAVNVVGRGDVLVVAKRDRIARDTFIAVLVERAVIQKGGRIVSSAGEGTESDDLAATFTRRILDAVAELERGLIAARTRAALQALKARGQRAGEIPWGFTVGEDGRTLVPHDGEQQVLDDMRELRAAGGNLRVVAQTLNERGYRTRRGGPWRHQYVWRLEVERQSAVE